MDSQVARLGQARVEPTLVKQARNSLEPRLDRLAMLADNISGTLTTLGVTAERVFGPQPPQATEGAAQDARRDGALGLLDERLDEVERLGRAVHEQAMRFAEL